MDDTPRRRGPPRVLHPDDETIETFRRLGGEGARHRHCAEVFGVCADTVRNFFNRCPEVRAVYETALAEGKARRRDVTRLRLATTGRLAAPGETCPTCGQRVGESNQTIILTPADIADARRKLEDLIDRHLGPDPAAPAE